MRHKRTNVSYDCELVCPQCGCGFTAKTYAHRVYCSRACYAAAYRKQQRPTTYGYYVVTVPGRGNILKHRLAMETHLGRLLGDDEIVHHKNGIRTDNRLDNLAVMTLGEHTRLHHLGRSQTGGRWARDFDACVMCGKSDTKHASRGRCRRCYERERWNTKKLPERWAKRLGLDACVTCGSAQHPHWGRGLCTLCYERSRERPARQH